MGMGMNGTAQDRAYTAGSINPTTTTTTSTIATTTTTNNHNNETNDDNDIDNSTILMIFMTHNNARYLFLLRGSINPTLLMIL